MTTLRPDRFGLAAAASFQIGRDEKALPAQEARPIPKTMPEQTSIPDRPSAALACCRFSGLPVYRAPDWHWTSASGDYALEIDRIGDRIISLAHTGHVDSLKAKRGVALFRRILAETPGANRPFVVLDDHSRIAGATLNARRYIVMQMLRHADLKAYIVYGTFQGFHLSPNLARRMHLFNFRIRVVADYAQAMTLAQRWLTPLEKRWANRSPTRPDGEDSALRGPCDTRAETALNEYARELLAHIGQLQLAHNRRKTPPVAIGCDHPFRAVYDALELIHVDMHRILARHQRNLKHLRSQERALLEKNAALAETHTTLKIILRTRREAHRRMTTRIGQRFRDVLLPIVEALEDTHPNGGQKRRVAFIRDIITHISQPFTIDLARDAWQPTAREVLTAYLVARGCTSREAARVIDTSPRTIDRYRAGLRKKAGLRGTGQRLGAWLRSRAKTEMLPGP